MPVHALVEARAEPDRVDEVAQAAQRFVDAVERTEPKARRVEAYRIEGTSTVIVHLVFEDTLAAREHREEEHTLAFTEAIGDAVEGFDVHELETLGA